MPDVYYKLINFLKTPGSNTGGFFLQNLLLRGVVVALRLR